MSEQTNFEMFLNAINHLRPLFELATTILWGIYIYFTIRTFREIKRQTDLQSEALLVVAAKTLDQMPPNVNIPDEAQKVHDKWKQILETNIPSAVQKEKYLILEFTNRGRSDIVGWEIRVMADISASDFLQNTYNIVGEDVEWTVCYKNHKDNIAPNDTIQVPIAVTGCFPEAKFIWLIEYSDTRDVDYQKFSGDPSYSDINALASPK